jgi:hypothetical protein
MFNTVQVNNRDQNLLDLTARLNGSVQSKAIVESELQESRMQVLNFAQDLYDAKLEASKFQDQFDSQLQLVNIYNNFSTKSLKMN